ncbi:MAG: hypothetical protein AAGA75_08890 [Cyanobacteria bacterium P01_E01_bin.6]
MKHTRKNQQNRNYWLLSSALAGATTLLLTGCGTLVLEEPDPRLFYVAGEVDTEDHRELVELLLYLIEAEASSQDILRVDFLEGEGIVNVLSAPPKQEAIYAVIEGMEASANEDTALSSSLYSLSYLTEQNPDLPIHAVLVTDGTTDETVIASMTGASEKLSAHDNLSLIVVGVSAQTRTVFSNSFSPIPSTVTFAGSIEELNAKFQSIGGH